MTHAMQLTAIITAVTRLSVFRRSSERVFAEDRVSPHVWFLFFHKFKSFQLKTLQRNFTVKIGQNQKNCAPCKQQNEQNEQQCGNINAFLRTNFSPRYTLRFLLCARFIGLTCLIYIASFPPFRRFIFFNNYFNTCRTAFQCLGGNITCTMGSF